MFWVLLTTAAMADSFTLDNDVTVEGVMTEYNLEGSCHIALSEGDLSGAVVILPCERIVQFVRTTPSDIPEEAISLTAPAPIFSDDAPVDAPFATAPVEAILPPAPPQEDAAMAAPTPAPQPAPEPEPTWEEEAPPQQEMTAPAAAPAPEEEPQAEDSRAEDDRGALRLPALQNLRLLRRGEGSSSNTN